jgi:hypothetical protein
VTSEIPAIAIVTCATATTTTSRLSRGRGPSSAQERHDERDNSDKRHAIEQITGTAKM